MNVRYRLLTGKFDRGEFWNTVGETTADIAVGRGRLGAAPAILKGGSALGALVTGYANTPKKVEAEDRSGSVDEVKSLLREGTLKPADLVDAGAGWQTFSQCQAFSDVCDELAEADEKRRGKVRLFAAAGAFAPNAPPPAVV